MKELFKPHIVEMNRYQTSLGRDLENGVRLDRNEKVSNFPAEIMKEVWGLFPNYSLSASPEAPPLYDAISKSLDISKDKIFISSGITEGIRILYEFICKPGDNVICLDPTYPMYMIYAKMQEIEYRKFTYNLSTLKPDWDTFKKNIDEKTKFLIIPNPNLPIESCLAYEELKEIAQICKTKGIFLVIDEAYHFFGAPSAIPLINDFDNIIIFRTFSKAYGLAGLRIGFMISQAQNIEYFSKSRSIVESNTPAMAIAKYMLEHPELKDAHIKECKHGADYLINELNKMGLRHHGGRFTNGILIWLNSKQESDDCVSYLRSKKVYIRGAFESPFENTIRVSIGPKAELETFVKEFTKWKNSEK